MKKETLWRAGIYSVGVLILAFGGALGTKTGLGISPINAIPFALNHAFSIQFSHAVFVFYLGIILLEFLIKGKNRQWRDLLQLPFSAVYSTLLGIFDVWIRVPDALWQRLAILAASVVLLGLGVTLIVNMRLVPNPADGLAAAIGIWLRRDMGFGKNLLDICCVAGAFCIDACFGTLWTSIGAATVVSALLIGRFVHLFDSLLHTRILSLAGLSSEI